MADAAIGQVPTSGASSRSSATGSRVPIGVSHGIGRTADAECPDSRCQGQARSARWTRGPPLPSRPAPRPRTPSPDSSRGPRSARGCSASPSASGADRSARAAAASSGSASPSSGPRGCWWRLPPVSSSSMNGRLIPSSSGPPSPWAGWRVPARWSSRRSATTATPRPPRPCSGRPSGWWSAGRRVSPAPRGGPDPVRSSEATAAGALGLALVAEGIGRLDYGWFDSTSQVSHVGARWLVAAGLALPVLLTRGRPAGVVASISVALLAAPVAAFVVVASHGLGLA